MQPESPGMPDGTAGLTQTTGGLRVSTALVSIVAVGILLYLVGWLAPVLAPLGLGLFLATLAAPLFAFVVRRGRSPSVAMVITVVVVLAIGTALVLLALVSTRTLSDSLSTYSDELRARYPDVASSGLPAAISGLVSPDTLTAVLRSVIGIVTQVGSNLVFATIVAALVLLDGPRIARLGTDRSANGAFRDGRVFAGAAVTYFAVRIRVNAVTAVGLLILMLVVGVDDALLWAVGAFFLSFVPYLGLTLALIPPTILAFAESGPLAAAVIVIGGIILNIAAENVIEPTLAGRAFSLATWLVFVMFFFWVWLIGPVGAILSMPITVLTVLILQGNARTQWVAAILTRQ
jgi:AI-2 transport protein TqsA